MKKLLLFVVVMITAISFGQEQSWRKVSENLLTRSEKVARDSKPKEFLLYSMDLSAMKLRLSSSPKRSATTISNIIEVFPNSNGELQHFKMYEASTLEPIIAAAHPEIQTYVGKCIEDPTATITITSTLFGLHAITHSGKNGTSYIDPYTKDLNNYVVYNKTQSESLRSRACGTADVSGIELPTSETLLYRSNNSLFKTYRLAMACTLQYATFHINAAGVSGGTVAQKKAAVLAAMVVTVARVNSVYERDFALTLVLINNNLNIVNVSTSPLDTNDQNGLALLNQIQAYIDGIIGTANYDMGHVVSTGGGGIASLGCVCTGIKAQGVTGLTAPVGDDYDIDFVAHEMGHQFGGAHTFNSIASNCAAPNRSASSAYEPGSGTTIQAYAGICAPEDVQPHSDAYFHARSLIQMTAQINAAGTNCAASQPNGNTPPVIFTNGDFTNGNNTIPFGTAFKLTGSATDVDNPAGDQLTYCWEHYNQTATSVALLPINATGPNFRSFNPTTSKERYFPKLSSVISNNLAPIWEVVPTVARVMTFSLVVRDNGGNGLGGQTLRATKTVTLANVGPFKVTSQNSQVAWGAPGTSETVTWDVAGTTANGINTATVTIKLSTDGGLTFPTILLANTPNDGSEAISVPALSSQTCRIMIEADGNVYYAVNTTNFLIGYTITPLCSTYNYSGAAFALTDGTGSTTKTIAVPASPSITDVNVTITATHPNIQNLIIQMSRPSGTALQLFNQQCVGNADMNIKFDQQGTALVCASPTTGTYIPSGTGNLNSLNVNAPAGNWSFNFKDAVAGNTGTINSIALEICKNLVTPILANNIFDFKDFALFPNPNSGNFTVRFDSNSSGKIAINVVDLSGRIIFEKSYTNTGLFDENIKLEKTQAGIYLVSITDGDKKIVKRIVIE
jgi:subtilisin-like proprotein convertase family protein